jgi:DNA-binding response OmpR family regulator
MKRKILIADGEREYQASCQRALEQEGYSVTLATTREEALSKIQLEDPDLVILDIRLPGDGADILGGVPQGGRGPSIIVTARHHPCDEDFVLWRAEEWFVKSRDLAPLKEAVARLLAARSAVVPPASPRFGARSHAGKREADLSPPRIFGRLFRPEPESASRRRDLASGTVS